MLSAKSYPEIFVLACNYASILTILSKIDDYIKCISHLSGVRNSAGRQAIVYCHRNSSFNNCYVYIGRQSVEGHCGLWLWEKRMWHRNFVFCSSHSSREAKNEENWNYCQTEIRKIAQDPQNVLKSLTLQLYPVTYLYMEHHSTDARFENEGQHPPFPAVVILYM